MPSNTAARKVFQFRNPDGLYDPLPNGYSHVAEIIGPARLVLCSGQGGETKDGELSPDFRTQLKQAFANVNTALVSAGATPRDVTRLVVLVVDHTEDKLTAFIEAQAEAFGADVKPACTLIPVPRLALDGMQIEIEATAALAA
jgi:enamine deaminase RidA (YjgF/YER057c/UK114 family)